jgi:hypothetical protein
MHDERIAMRDSELHAYALYLADYADTHPSLGRPLQTWEELTEGEQLRYKMYSQASLKWLFEHGRIVKFIHTKEKFEALRAQYREYLASSNKSSQDDISSTELNAW